MLIFLYNINISVLFLISVLFKYQYITTTLILTFANYRQTETADTDGNVIQFSPKLENWIHFIF